MQEADLREICTLPEQFPSSGLSWVDLVRQSPFPGNRDCLEEGHLADFLRANPEFIELWLRWSADKRATPSPFFRESDTRYEVGYVTTGGGTEPSDFFDEPFLPCARFILRELAV